MLAAKELLIFNSFKCNSLNKLQSHFHRPHRLQLFAKRNMAAIQDNGEDHNGLHQKDHHKLATPATNFKSSAEKHLNLEDPEHKRLFEIYKPEQAPVHVRGIEVLKTSEINKGMGFSLYERQYLGIHGLLPPAFMTVEQQAYRVMASLREKSSDLERYIALDNLQDRDEKLFYRVIIQNIKELMPIVYTPTVGEACKHFGFIYRKPKGLYVTINDNSISKIYQILENWPHQDVRAIVVTDGERILGLGDLGCYGVGIPVGKLALYVALGGVQPRWCLPIMLDVGTDNEELLKDPFYIGLRKRRVRGEEYDQFIENFMCACVKRFGQNTLIQFEDFGNKNAYRLLDKYQFKYCTFNDDIQGTAAVVVAGLLASTRVLKCQMKDMRYLFFGAGGAGLGISEMCVRQMESEGMSTVDAQNQIFMMDKDGLITKDRENIDPRHVNYAKDMEQTSDLLRVIKEVKPHVLIGTSTVGGTFTEEVVKTMAELHERPIIFALSNPTKNSECTAKEAYEWTNGRVLFASGSPFDNVTVNGKLYKPGQGNNAYIFPGVALGIILFQINHIDSRHFLLAARVVTDYVTEHNLSHGRIYPRIQEIRNLSIQIAKTIAEECYKDRTATLYPEPEHKEMYIHSQIYSVEYEQLISTPYDWPKEDMRHGFPVPVERKQSLDEVDD